MADPPVRDRAVVVRVLASFVAPVRAEALAPAVAAAGGRDPVAATVAFVREHYRVGDPAIAVALDDAGLPARRIASLLDREVRAVDEWLDDEASTLPVRAPGPAVPGRLRTARRVVRLVWVLLALTVVVTMVHARGGLTPCPQAVCVDHVELVLAGGTTVAAADRPAVAPDEVVAVRFHHRAPGTWAGTVRWTVDDEQLLSRPVRLQGDGALTVDAPSGALPVGAHVVAVEGRGQEATAAFAVQR